MGSSNGDLIKYMPFETFFSLDILSNIMYGVSGLSMSARSNVRPFISILFGSGSWQTSQSNLKIYLF